MRTAKPPVMGEGAGGTSVTHGELDGQKFLGKKQQQQSVYKEQKLYVHPNNVAFSFLSVVWKYIFLFDDYVKSS